jgi:hypothetical protein
VPPDQTQSAPPQTATSQVAGNDLLRDQPASQASKPHRSFFARLLFWRSNSGT